MYCLMITCDIIPEKLSEGDEWLEKVGLDFWAKQDCVTRASLLKFAMSSFQRRVYLIETPSMDAIQKVMDSPERLRVLSDFLKYVTNVSNATFEFMTTFEKG